MEAVRKPSDNPLSLYFVCLAIGTLAAVFLYPVTLEDALITFHYARAFAAGQGIGTWNVGQPPVEGFSSALWMLLIGFGDKLELSPFAISKAFGYFGYALTSVLFLVASRRSFADDELEDNSLALYLSALMSAVFVPLIYYSVTGMEATFFCCEVAAALLAPFLLRSNGGRAVWSSLFAVAMVSTRPEGIFVAVAISAYWLYVFKNKSYWPAAALTFALSTFAVTTAYRLHRFGELVPNTYFAKATGGTLAHRLFLGARYEGHFLAGLAPFTIVFILGILVSAGLMGRSSHRGLALFLLGFFALFTLYVLKVGGDAWGAFPFYRQFEQIAPLWILFSALTLVSLAQGRRLAILCALALVLLTDAEVVAISPYRLITRPSQLLARYGLFQLEPPNPYFIWLRQFSTPDTVTAVSLAGQWPFYVPGRYIDILGLNDAYIAKHGHIQLSSPVVDSKTDVAYVLSRRPDIIDGYSSGLLILAGKCPIDEFARAQMVNEMIDDPKFKEEYVFIRNAPYKDFDRALYFRKDYAARFPGRLDAVPVAETSLYRPGCPFRQEGIASESALNARLSTSRKKPALAPASSAFAWELAVRSKQHVHPRYGVRQTAGPSPSGPPADCSAWDFPRPKASCTTASDSGPPSPPPPALRQTSWSSAAG